MTTPGVAGLLTVAAVLAAAPAEAKVYRWVDERGVVTYSDRPRRVEPVRGEREPLIDEALERSGLRREVEALPGLMRAAIEREAARFTPDIRPPLLAAVDDLYQPAAFVAAVRSALARQDEPHRLGTAVAWLRLPAIRRLAALETGMTPPAPPGAPGAEPPGASPPAHVRRALVQRCLAARGGVELFQTAAVEGFRASLLKVETVLPAEQRPPWVQVEAALAAIADRRPTVLESAEEGLLAAFREVSDDEIEEYATFLESDAGRWLFATGAAAVRAVLEAALDAVLARGAPGAPAGSAKP